MSKCLFANEKQVDVDVLKARHKATLPELIIYAKLNDVL